MTAVHATPAFRPHEALGPLKVKKVVFHHQALAHTHSMMSPPCTPACERALCEKSSGTGRGAKDQKEVPRRRECLGAILQSPRFPTWWRLWALAGDIFSRIELLGYIISSGQGRVFFIVRPQPS